MISPPSRFADVVWFAAPGLAAFAALSLILDPAAAGFTAFLAVAMAAITWSDVRFFIVPDVISLPAIPIGLAANSVVIHQAWGSGLLESLWGATLGAGILYLVRYAYFRLRNIEGLGLGDVKLGAVAGAWLGPGLLAPACLAATLTALLVVLLMMLSGRTGPSTQLHIPFGSFMAPVIVLFWGFRLWELGLPVT